MFLLGVSLFHLLSVRGLLTRILLFSSIIQVAAIIAGAAVAAAAYAGKYGIEAWQAFKLRPVRPRMRKFYEGGFQATMTRREAALILGVRYLSCV